MVDIIFVDCMDQYIFRLYICVYMYVYAGCQVYALIAINGEKTCAQ